MEDANMARAVYDLPQDQLDYFGSHSTPSKSAAPAVSVRKANDPTVAPRQRDPVRRTHQQHRVARDEDDDDEPKLSMQHGSLSMKYQEYFAIPSPQQSEVRSTNIEIIASSIHTPNTGSRKALSPPRHLDTRQKPQQLPRKVFHEQSNSVSQNLPSAPPPAQAYPSHQGTSSVHSNTAQPATAEPKEDCYWSHNASSVSPHLSAVKEPRAATIPSSSTVPESRNRVNSPKNSLSTPQNEYKQPHLDRREATPRKLSASRGTPVSRDNRSTTRERSSSASVADIPPLRRSAAGVAAAPQTQDSVTAHAYVPRRADVIAPVRQAPPLEEHQHQRQQQPRGQPQQRRDGDKPQRERVDDEYAKMLDDEKNCTFHPAVNSSATKRRSGVQDSPYRRSEVTNPPGNAPEPDPYDKLYKNADAVRRASDSRRVQRDVDDLELEMNARYGPHATAINPSRAAAKRDANQDEVFARLYADAQRYNQEKAEQERLLELKREEERGDAPFDWNKGKPRKSGVTEGEAGEGGSATLSKQRRSVSNQKPVKNMEVFERLSKPHTVTMSFQKQKELEEEEKHEKEQKEIERKNAEMEKIAAYHWGIPAKSFTFADLESQNALYAS